MAKGALIEQRPWLLASITAATAFYFLSDNPVFEGTWGLLAKGASVGLLALYVLLRLPHGRRGLDGALVVAMLVLAAAGDVAIELDFVIGGAFFAAAHCVSVVLYLRNLHKRPSPTQKMTGAALLISTPLVSYLLSGQAQIAHSTPLGGPPLQAFFHDQPRGGLRDFRARLQQATDAATTAREAVTAIVGANIDWISAHPDWARFVFTHRVVREAGADWLLFDFNHPLAGQPVRFEVQVLGIL